MKKMLLAVALGLGLMLVSNQQASAWSKFNFGVGLNIGWEGGGNTVLWGLLKGADSPVAHVSMGGPVEPLGAPMPVIGDHGHGVPRALPSAPNMPRADTQPVGYFQEQNTDSDDYYAPSYWFGGR